ncbi:flavin monoamine oxidase family protein [Crenalkalicoccus roseus]|uniref:flavin monoamine oxidase family protein n=1 Tax=Crenalkalicoccus roseus TaxID=1485588 RepID=UPI001081BFCC|nr:FAD-dependent oxidoreductase [Crenalkalicoccus roseus]
MTREAEVLVLGAGAAGIAAARRLRALGRDCLVLEAGMRAGGRAFTDHSLGAPCDLGASWLHDAGANPLTPLAQALGFTLHDTGRRRRDLLLAAGGRPATAEERAAWEAAVEAFDAAALARARRGGPDIPLSEAVPRGGPWDDTAAHWLSAMISAAEAERISLQDYVATLLDGWNPQVAEGVGTLLLRLAEGLPVVLGAAVGRLRWRRGGILAEGSFGSLRTRAAIITVSTGVLAAGAIAFDPPLPDGLQDAVTGLPLGLLSKVVLRAAGEERLGLGPFARLGRQVEAPGDSPMSWLLWPFGRPYAVGFLGGARAWALSREGPAAAEAEARAELARYFGAAAVARIFAPGAVVTRWGEDPLFRGAYSHALPGCAGARAVLAEAALLGGRLRFAGEACHPRYAGTVGGAWQSGERAARAVHAALG